MSTPHFNVELLMSDFAQVCLPEENQEVSDSVQVPASLGAILSAARIEKNWSVEYVAEYLKLSPKQIISIESNDYGQLPTMVIVRGFVRAYVKMLKLDAEQLLAMLPGDGKVVSMNVPLRPSLSTPFVESKTNLLGRDENNRLYKIGIALISLVLIVFFVWFYQAQIKTKINSIFPALFAEPVVSAVKGDDLVLPDVLEKSVTVVEAPSSTSASLASDQVRNGASLPVEIVASKSSENHVAASLPVVPQVVSQVASQVIEVGVESVKKTASLDVLHLKMVQDSWLQVKTEKGVILFSRLAKSGTEESFPLNVPLHVKVGNSAGVQAKVRGEALILNPEGGTNVINLLVK
jgi:cytoskeleton protein RodZ